MDTLRGMAEVVDRQNAGDAAYQPGAMVGLSTARAFKQARLLDLVFNTWGREQPNGYTEWLLKRWRQTVKAVRA